jgi:hypothetical protein
VLPRVEYSILAPASAERSWEAFCNLQRLLGRGLYSDATWIEGAPWQVGSRVRYTLAQPVEATVTAVVTEADPPRRVGLLNHGLGITAQQLVTFHPVSERVTRVSMSMEFVGESKELSPAAVEEALRFVTQDALDSMLPLLDQRGTQRRENAG